MKTAIEEARDRLRIAYKYYPASFREGFIDCLQIFERHYATPAQQYAKELKSPMPQNENESVAGVYFITTQEGLSQETFDRLKKQIDEAWPNNLPRPILLEGCNIVKL